MVVGINPGDPIGRYGSGCVGIEWSLRAGGLYNFDQGGEDNRAEEREGKLASKRGHWTRMGRPDRTGQGLMPLANISDRSHVMGG